MNKNQSARLRLKANAVNREEQMKQNKIAGDVLQFYSMQQRKKQWDEQFDQVKQLFYSYMQEHNIDDALYKSEYHNEEVILKVKKVQRKTIVWNVTKLFKKLSKKKKVRDQVIEKKYFIMDFEGLVEYLKECNVDPKIFKSFLEVDMLVNENVLNNLHDLGEVSKSDISGCYEVKKSNPYWTVRRENGKEE